MVLPQRPKDGPQLRRIGLAAPGAVQVRQHRQGPLVARIQGRGLLEPALRIVGPPQGRRQLRRQQQVLELVAGIARAAQQRGDCVERRLVPLEHPEDQIRYNKSRSQHGQYAK